MHIRTCRKHSFAFYLYCHWSNAIYGDGTVIWLLNCTNAKLEGPNPLTELQFCYVHFYPFQLKQNTQDFCKTSS